MNGNDHGINWSYVGLCVIVIIVIVELGYLIGGGSGGVMSISELMEYNYKLWLISNAGLIHLNRSGCQWLKLLTNDPLLIKMHRRLQNKYGCVVKTYISTTMNYYILDQNLAKKILMASPMLFSAGKLKYDAFFKFMPLNLGISVGCPWKNRRNFNENVLGTKLSSDDIFSLSNRYSCLHTLVEKNLTIMNGPLLIIDDFRKLAFNLTSDIIFGICTCPQMEQSASVALLKQFMLTYDHLDPEFYQTYIDYLHLHLKQSQFTCSLLSEVNKITNEYGRTLTSKEIDDQIPHWFGPFIYIINFLIPNILCILLSPNYTNVYKRLIREMNEPDFETSGIYSNDTYLHHCVIEHIRLFNTININIQRTVVNDIQLAPNLYVKKGDQLFMLFASILRDPKLFQEPDCFIPERWANPNLAVSQDIVFGVGLQQCPSRRITPVLYKLLVYHIFKNTNIFKYTVLSPKLTSRELYFINPFDITFYQSKNDAPQRLF